MGQHTARSVRAPVRSRSGADRWRTRACSLLLVLAVLAAAVVTVMIVRAAEVSADPDLFDPAIGVWDEPILVASDGDEIPLDQAGLGGSMFDGLPQDELTDHEQGIVDDIIAALNHERTMRDLPFEFIESDHITAVNRRWVERMSSDADNDPSCPIVIESCDIDAETQGLFNEQNGMDSTLSLAGGGATGGRTKERAGGFVGGLLLSGGNHYAHVLVLNGRFAGVGVYCQPDGASYLTWGVAEWDLDVRSADPWTYEGPVVDPFTPGSFGRRCRQPHGDVDLVPVATGFEVVPVEPTSLSPGRLEIDGPMLGDDVRTWREEIVVVAEGAEEPTVVATRALLDDDYQPIPMLVTGLPEGVYDVTVRAFNDYETSLTRTEQVTVGTPPVGLELVTPARLVDTRAGETTIDGVLQGIGLRPSASTLHVPVAGRSGVPADADAVVLTVAAVGPAGHGFVTVWPCDAERPVASNITHDLSAPVTGNLVMARLDGDGEVCVYNHASAHLVVDLAGYVVDGDPPDVVSPVRLIDTRDDPGTSTIDGVHEGGGRLLARWPTPFDVAGRGGVPDGAEAVFLNVAVTQGVAPGFLTMWSCDDARPLASQVNYAATASAVSNLVVAALDDQGRVCGYSHARAHLVADVAGYLLDDEVVTLVTPSRLVDTRTDGTASTIDGQFEAIGGRAAESTLVVDVAGRAGVPDGASGVLLTVTAASPTGNGFVTVWPCGVPRPITANVNYLAGQPAIANAVAAPLDDVGRVCLYTHAATELVVDLNAYVDAPGL